jgi:hypothetical protein
VFCLQKWVLLLQASKRAGMGQEKMERKNWGYFSKNEVVKFCFSLLLPPRCLEKAKLNNGCCNPGD